MQSKLDLIQKILEDVDIGVDINKSVYSISWHSDDKTAAFYCRIADNILHFQGLGKLRAASKSIHLSNPDCIDEFRSYIITTLESYGYNSR